MMKKKTITQLVIGILMGMLASSAVYWLVPKPQWYLVYGIVAMALFALLIMNWIKK